MRLFQKTSFLYWPVAFTLVFIIAHFVHEKFIFDKPGNYFTSSHYKPYPYIMFKRDRGYRGPFPEKVNERGEFRIFILGGSSVYGGEAPFSILLEKIFHKQSYKKVRVFNFGALSSTHGQDVARILYEVVDYHPDLIVMYGGSNDLVHPFYADPRPGYPFNFMVYESIYENGWISSETFSFPWTLLLYRSSILRQLFPDFFLKQITNIHKLRSQVGYGAQEWKKQIVSAYWNYIRKAKKLSLAYKFNLLVIFQAVAFGKKTSPYNRSIPLSAKDWNFMFEYLLNSVEQNKDILFFDRSGIFDHIEEQVFSDFVHIKQEYEKDVALELFEIITATKLTLQ